MVAALVSVFKGLMNFPLSQAPITSAYLQAGDYNAGVDENW